MTIKSTPKNDLYKPIIYDKKKSDDEKKLINLLQSNQNIEIIDEIESQLKELIKLRSPSKNYNKEELAFEVQSYLNDVSINDIGNWIYYPWNNKLIHLLSKNEFIEVRTNRNKNKITDEEQKTLLSKKIGIIGLSVGKAIAQTIATERVCGELVLADFDEIELSNLNRIQTGVHNLGVKKTIAAAREIAECDPYLKVTCFNEGLTLDNADDFFIKNGKLDICIEVCDGLFAKIFVREKAKEFGIPVVMDTNDRGMIDIERFDLEPRREIFHGFLKQVNYSNINENSSPTEKAPIVNAIIGLETMSEKLKESMTKIGKTLTSWPQLSSSVTLGGAITCSVSRRILLNELNTSGRFHVDVNEIIK